MPGGVEGRRTHKLRSLLDAVILGSSHSISTKGHTMPRPFLLGRCRAPSTCKVGKDGPGLVLPTHTRSPMSGGGSVPLLGPQDTAQKSHVSLCTLTYLKSMCILIRKCLNYFPPTKVEIPGKKTWSPPLCPRFSFETHSGPHPAPHSTKPPASQLLPSFSRGGMGAQCCSSPRSSKYHQADSCGRGTSSRLSLPTPARQWLSTVWYYWTA